MSSAGNAAELSGFGLGAEGGEALDGKNLLVEDQAELTGDLMGDSFEALAGSARRSGQNCILRRVTGRSVMPQGLMRAKSRRSVVTLKAKP